MKYKVGDKTLLGEIDRYEENSCYCCRVENKWWLTEPDVDKIIIKPKRNIDHLAELWEMDSGAAYKFWKDNSRMNSVCYEDVAFMLAPYTEPSKYPQLTPEEIKALKLARDCGFKFIQRDGSLWVSPTGKTMSWVGVQWIPSLDGLLRSNWITHEPMSINELLDAQERREPE